MTSNAGDHDNSSPRGIPRRSLVFASLMLAGLMAASEGPNYSEERKTRVPSGMPKSPDSPSEPGTLHLNPTSFVVHTDDWIRWWRWHIRTNWLHSEGPASPLGGRENFPVVQLPWGAALAGSACPQRSNGRSQLATASTPGVASGGASGGDTFVVASATRESGTTRTS